MNDRIFSNAEVEEIFASCKRGEFDLNKFHRDAATRNEMLGIFPTIVLVTVRQLSNEEIKERYLGELVAIQKGLVMLLSDHFSVHDGYPVQERYCGFLEKVEMKTAIVRVGQTFHGRPFYTDASFTDRRATGKYPGMLYWQIGSGQGESYGREKFDPMIWAKVVAFLDTWLPA